jgi:hypothetical protein
MRLKPIPTGLPTAPRLAARAFSLTEMMAAGAVFGLVMAAVIYSNLHGMKMIEVAQPKLAAEDEAQRLLLRLSEEIASARLLLVGEGNASTFTPVDPGAPRQGGALQLHLTTDTNAFVRYYRDDADQALKRCSSDAPDITVLARAVTNGVVFAKVDYRGWPDGVLTNDPRHLAISVLLQFSEIEGTRTPVGADRYFKSHQFQTQIARRSD